jgi:Na+/melibiose symporter-like transporter
MLQAFGYQAGVGFPQPPTVVLGVKITFFVITAAGGLLSLLSIRVYPYKGERLRKLKSDIVALHLDKEKKTQIK